MLPHGGVSGAAGPLSSSQRLGYDLSDLPAALNTEAGLSN